MWSNSSRQLAAQLRLCPCPPLACPLELYSWSLCLTLFQIHICFSWPKALASYGVALQTECPADRPQSISPFSSFRRTKQTSLESSEEALSRVSEGRRVCLLTLKENLGLRSPSCEYGNDFPKEYGALSSSTTEATV